MKFLVEVPNFGRWSDPHVFADFAREVEQAGWDGLAVWDHILGGDDLEVADPWVLLTAAAIVTERIRLMTMVTPLPRRHPWKLARETATLDLLSGGRLILGVGLGWPTDPEFTRFGGEEDLRVRGEMLDEGLGILAGLWSGEPFAFQGEHYGLEQVTFRPTPAQKPRIPIWVAATWPYERPIRRAARWDGIVPGFFSLDTDEYTDPTPEIVEQIVARVREHRTSDEPFDVVLPGDPRRAVEFEEVGVTWWRNAWAPFSGISHDDWLGYIPDGPPGN